MPEVSFMKAAFEYGLTFTVAISAFAFLIWYVRCARTEAREDMIAKDHLSERDRNQMREDILRMSARISDQETFIREKLLAVVEENSKAISTFASTFDKINTTMLDLDATIKHAVEIAEKNNELGVTTQAAVGELHRLMVELQDVPGVHEQQIAMLKNVVHLLESKHTVTQS